MCWCGMLQCRASSFFSPWHQTQATSPAPQWCTRFADLVWVWANEWIYPLKTEEERRGAWNIIWTRCLCILTCSLTKVESCSCVFNLENSVNGDSQLVGRKVWASTWRPVWGQMFRFALQCCSATASVESTLASCWCKTLKLIFSKLSSNTCLF